MSKAKKIIAVTADWELASKYVRKAAEKAASELAIPFEDRKEDWEFLLEHGVKDEFGGVELPQLFIEYEDGRITHLFNRVPLDENGKPDIEKAVEIIVKAASSPPG